MHIWQAGSFILHSSLILSSSYALNAIMSRYGAGEKQFSWSWSSERALSVDWQVCYSLSFSEAIAGSKEHY